MKIQQRENDAIYNNIAKRLLNSPQNKLLFIAMAFFILGVISMRSGMLSSIRHSLLNSYQTSMYKLAGLSDPPTTRMVIDVKFKHYKILKAQRDEALRTGRFFADGYVPAVIGINGESYKVKIRPKGDKIDHFEGDKWSFRVKVKGDNTILGMKTFSLHHPKTRNYLSEWLFQKILKHEGIISLRYDFIDVVVNGQDLGIYAIEEHFEKRLIENNLRKEGPIIKFSEDDYWNPKRILSDEESYLSSKIDGFNYKKVSEDSVIYDQYRRAVTLLKNYRNGKLKFNQVFDLDLFAKHFALSRLFTAGHGERWHNRRFYLNPITDILEPIGFDSNAMNLRVESNSGVDLFNNSNLHYWIQAESMNYELISLISKYMEKYLSHGWLDSTMVEFTDDYDRLYRTIQGEWPEYRLDKNILFDNQKLFISELNPVNPLQCYMKRSGNEKLELLFGNSQSYPIEVKSVEIDGLLEIFPDERLVIPGKIKGGPMGFSENTFHLPNHYDMSSISSKNITVSFGVLGTSRTTKVEVLNWDFFPDSTVASLYLNRESNVDQFDFISISDTTNEIYISQGSHKIDRDIHIPSGYRVICTKGTTIDLVMNSAIVIKSSIEFIGSDDFPIKIISSDSSGQGIFILEADDKSVLENVNFYNLSNPKKNNWSLTGAVTFYKSDVDIRNCIFSSNIVGDDYLNIVRSEFLIDQSLFINTKADALDADFCRGIITDSYFSNCGNDGIDISGSNVKIDYVTLDGIGDKGISAGENSYMDIKDIKISNSEIGICSKDKSSILGLNLNLENVRIGLTAFQKKSEYGPGNINCSQINISNIEIPYLIEKGSICKIDGGIVESNNERVNELLYGNQYGKASK
jgi:hypothetical protein